MEDQTRSFVESVKGGLFDNLLNQIDDKFHPTSFIPPRELIPYLEGKELETEEEAQDYRRLFNKWQEDTLRVLKRRPSSEILREFLEALPEPFKGDLIRALGDLIVKS